MSDDVQAAPIELEKADRGTEDAPGKAFVCVTCGAQYPPSAVPPAECAICEDERQYVGFDGQRWTTLEELRAERRNQFETVEPGLTMIGTRPTFAIGQHAFLVHPDGSDGNVLWDCFSLVDDATVARLEELGGVRSIAISHPHFYTTCVEWSRALGGVPVLLHADDSEWVVRPDPCIVQWEGATHALGGGITLIRGGGHFTGSAMLHWAAGAEGRGVVLASDTISVAYDRKRATWMYSFMNFLPLSPGKVRGTVEALRPFPYDRLYSAWPHRFIARNAAAVVEASAARYIEAMTDA